MKYLDIYVEEFLDCKCTSSMLTGAGDRTLGSIISKFKYLRNVFLKPIPDCITLEWYK